MKSYFLITSSGAAATRWVGASLNRHMDICCSCGSGELAETLIYGRPNSREYIDRTAAFLWDRCMGAQAELRPLDRMFDELESHREARLYGNIHGETLITLSANLQASPLHRQVRVVNLVRHPIPRTQSKFGMIQHDCELSAAMRKVCEFQVQDRLNRMAPIADAIRDQIGDFEASAERRYFVSALLDTVGASAEFVSTPGFPEVPQYRVEQIKESREGFAELIQHLSDGQLRVSQHYLDAIFSADSLNSERYRAAASGPARTAEDQWRDWQDWQQRAFHAAMQSSPLCPRFESVGYDFSFVGAPKAPLFPGFALRRRPAAAPPPPAVAAPALFNQTVLH